MSRREEKVQSMAPKAPNTASITPTIREIVREPMGFDDFHGTVAVDRLDE